MRAWKYVCAIALAMSAGNLAAQDVVQLRIRGKFFSAPATFNVTVSVKPDQQNRTLVVEADGDRLFRSSEVALDGAKEQRIHTVEFKNLPAGQYVLSAEVISDTRESLGRVEELVVVGDPGDQP